LTELRSAENTWSQDEATVEERIEALANQYWVALNVMDVEGLNLEHLKSDIRECIRKDSMNAKQRAAKKTTDGVPSNSRRK